MASQNADALPGPAAEAAATPLRILAIGICVAITMVDGFDVFATAYTVPQITRDWRLGPDKAGLLLSAGLAGMAIGTLFLSALADFFGRRRIILFWMIVVGAAMLASAAVQSYWALLVLRLVAGLGIGALSPVLAVLVSEISPPRHRDLVLGLLSAGFPAGAIAGGLVAAPLLAAYGWQSIYLLGGAGALLLLPFAYFGLPESIETLRRRGTAEALARARRTQEAMGLPPADPDTHRDATRDRASPLRTMRLLPNRGSFLVLLGCYTLCLASVYFINSWTPKLATGFGLSDSDAINVSVLQSVGSVLGGLFTGLLTARLGRSRLALLSLAAFALLLSLYPVTGHLLGANALGAHGLMLGLAMFCSGIGMFAMMIDILPASARATGLGLAVGIGRIGAASGPYGAGLLFAAGLGPLAVCAIMASLVGAVALVLWIRADVFAPATGSPA